METSSVQSLQRTFALLETLAARPEGESLTRLGTATNLSKSTAHRLLSNLIQLGYVMQDKESRKFHLTVKLFEVGASVVQRMNILTMAKPFMFELSRKLGEIVNLAIRDNDHVLYIYIEEGGENAVKVASHVGARNPMYCTAVGKAIMAGLPDAEIERIWSQSSIIAHTPTTITTLPAFMEAIRSVRNTGHSFDQEEYEPGIWCVAASVVNYSNAVQGALSVSAPMSRLSEAFRDEVAREVMLTCKRISAGFGKTQW